MLPQDPADSLYRVARSLMNRDQNRQAAEIFRTIPQRYPTSGYAPIAMYYEAFALYRIGGQNELEAALDVLARQKQRFPNAKNEDPGLETRIRGELASRGDRNARNAVRTQATQGVQTCNRDDMAIRIEALNALSRMNIDSVTPILRQVLSRRDECSNRLRSQAVLLLTKNTDPSVTDVMIDVVRNDPSSDVRRTAISWLGEVPSERGIAALEEVLRSPVDANLHSSALRALASIRNPRTSQAIRSIIERSGTSERVRMDAMSALARADTAGISAYLRSVYPRLETQRLKEAVVDQLARLPVPENKSWLTALARNPAEPMALRQSALRALTRYPETSAGGRGVLQGQRGAAVRNPGAGPPAPPGPVGGAIGGVAVRGGGRAAAPPVAPPARPAPASAPMMSIAEIAQLYDAIPELELKQQVITSLASRPEPEAVERMIAFYRGTTDPKLQLHIVTSLRRRNDPRAQQFLIEVINR
jgi:hypothetical protein